MEATNSVLGTINDSLDDFFAQTVHEIGLKARARNALEAAGVLTVGELVRHTEQEIGKWRGIGPKTIVEIKTILGKKRISLGSSVEIGPKEFLTLTNAPLTAMFGRVLKNTRVDEATYSIEYILKRMPRINSVVAVQAISLGDLCATVDSALLSQKVFYLNVSVRNLCENLKKIATSLVQGWICKMN